MLFFLFLCAEVVLLVKLGQSIGAAGVLLEVLATGVAGYLLVRTAGRSLLRNVALTALLIRFPARDLLRPPFRLFLAGLLLLIPGVMTDAIAVGLILSHPFRRRPVPGPADPAAPDVIDVDFRVHRSGGDRD